MRVDKFVRASAIATALSPLLAVGCVTAQENFENDGAPSYASHSGSGTIPDHPMMRDRFFISAGALYAESNVTASLNSGTFGLGSIIDFENDLGLEEWETIGLFQARMRLSERWRLEVEYFNLDREHEQEIPRTITWGDLNVPVNAFVRTSFDIEDIRVSVGYSFYKTQDKEVGVGVGAHVMDMEAQLDTRNFGSQRASESAPLPVITMYFRMALTDRWLLAVRVDRLSLDTGDIDGSIFSSGAEFVFQPWRHFNIGIGYRDINIDVTSTSETWRGEARISESGPVLFFGSSF